MSSKYCQKDFDALFLALAPKFRAAGWEARLEDPPQAYIHVSKPLWGDENMNGIHFEAYILGKQVQDEEALVALHCERGCPFQEKFQQIMTSRFQEEQKKSPDLWGAYAVSDHPSVVFERNLSFSAAADAEAAVAIVYAEIQKLQGLAEIIDTTIAECTN